MISLYDFYQLLIRTHDGTREEHPSTDPAAAQAEFDRTLQHQLSALAVLTSSQIHS
jgi:hypothetical protein